MFDRCNEPPEIFLRMSLIALTFLVQSQTPLDAASEKFQTYEQFAGSNLPQEILLKVIARGGKSKNYRQVIPLDGGTVGIANFAVGGLTDLYRIMDTEMYFHKTRAEMISKYSNGCRPGKHRGDDTGWGCYAQHWWKLGMEAFVSSPESVAVENRAWLEMMKPTVQLAQGHGWTNARSLAIAAGVANSVGVGGFNKLAATHNWRPEEVLSAYVAGTKKSAHRERRREAIDKTFPP